MNKPNQELIQKIQITEQAIQDAKSLLKNWANDISKYHKTLKELSSQLATIKTQLNMKNKTNQGGSK